MLPKNILDVAKANGIKILKEPLKDGQVRISCPECRHVDITCIVNPLKNVYYCPSCKKGGGVKKFSAFFSKTVSDSDKRKFGAASLSKAQLDKVGWGHLKTESIDFYKKHHKQAYQKWLEYQNEHLTKLYAIYLVMHEMKNKDNGGKIYNYLLDAIEHSLINDLSFEVFMDASLGIINSNSTWVKKGEKIAKAMMAYSLNYGDFDFDITAMLIIFDFHQCTVEINKEPFKWYSTKRFYSYSSSDLFNWEKYLYNSLVYHFALFTIMQNEQDTKIQIDIYRKIHLMQQRSMLQYDITLLVEEYVKEDIFRCDWAREGTRLARLAWHHAGMQEKHEYLTALFIQTKILQFNNPKINFKGAII